MKTSRKAFVCLMTVCAGFLTGNIDGLSITDCKETKNWITFIGKSVAIPCNYPQTDESDKMFCINKPFTCKNIISLSSLTTDPSKFLLSSDEQQVEISRLTEEDSDTYKYGVLSGESITCLSETVLHVFNRDNIVLTDVDYDASQSANIKCPYPDEFKNEVKRLCQQIEPNLFEELINTAQNNVGRFDINDNPGSNFFTVGINHPTKTDSRKYWCISGSNENVPTELSVGAMIAGIVCLVFFTVGTILILYRWRLLKTQVCCAAGDSSGQRTTHSTERENTNANNEEVHMQNQPAKTATAGDASVTPPAAADRLHYASVNFQKDESTSPYSKCSSDKSERHPRAETTLYSTITKTEE